jgi:hypothetical protein
LAIRRTIVDAFLLPDNSAQFYAIGSAFSKPIECPHCSAIWRPFWCAFKTTIHCTYFISFEYPKLYTL